LKIKGKSKKKNASKKLVLTRETLKDLQALDQGDLDAVVGGTGCYTCCACSYCGNAGGCCGKTM
jgi:hypothetical protein